MSENEDKVVVITTVTPGFEIVAEVRQGNLDNWLQVIRGAPHIGGDTRSWKYFRLRNPLRFGLQQTGPQQVSPVLMPMSIHKPILIDDDFRHVFPYESAMSVALAPVELDRLYRSQLSGIQITNQMPPQKPAAPPFGRTI